MIEATAAREAVAPAPAAAGDKEPTSPRGPGLSFWDLLDVINPLQHIPVVSTIYRRLTGDVISPLARIAGATLFGGPLGAAFALVDTAVEHKTGRDIGANALAALFPEDKPDAPTAVARATTPAAATVQGFAPRISDPIQLVPAASAATASFVAPTAPDLQILAGFTTATGQPAAPGEPIKLAPRHAIGPWQAERAPDDAPRSYPARTWVTPAQDIPKGAAASLSRQAMRAYAASTGVAPVTPAPSAVRAVEQATEAGQNDWIVEAMMRALDKYSEGSRLQANSAAPAHAVWR